MSNFRDLDFIVIKKSVAMCLLSLIFKVFITTIQNKRGQWDYHIFLARDPFCFIQETVQSKVHISLISSALVTPKQKTIYSVTLKETLKGCLICRLTWEIYVFPGAAFVLPALRYHDSHTVPLYRANFGHRHLFLSQWAHRLSQWRPGILNSWQELNLCFLSLEKQVYLPGMLFERTMFYQYLHCANKVGVWVVAVEGFFMLAGLFSFTWQNISCSELLSQNWMGLTELKVYAKAWLIMGPLG